MLIPFHSVVFVNLYGGRAFVYESLIILYSYLWRKRCIILIHSGLMPIFVQRWPRWSHFVFSYSSLVLTPSEFLKKKLCQLGIQVDGVIPNFIDLEDYSFKERAKLEPKFIYVRGFWSVYNPEMALKAFAIVQGLYPNASLTMAGREGDSSGKCRSLARDLALKNIQFVGLVEKKNLFHWLPAMIFTSIPINQIICQFQSLRCGHVDCPLLELTLGECHILFEITKMPS